jgi:hypothetical protein
LGYSLIVYVFATMPLAPMPEANARAVTVTVLVKVTGAVYLVEDVVGVEPFVV